MDDKKDLLNQSVAESEPAAPESASNSAPESAPESVPAPESKPAVRRVRGIAALLAEEETEQTESFEEEDKPLDKNLKLMSPGRMVARRFFRSKLSIIGLVMLVSLLVFCWLGPVLYHPYVKSLDNTWLDAGNPDLQTNTDYFSEELNYDYNTYTVVEEDGRTYTVYEVIESRKLISSLLAPSARHLLGTDESGMDVFARLMYGGRVSLGISFIAVFAIMIIGVIFGGIAGYFGGKVDNVIMRLCDILMCLPGLPILLILGSLLNAYDIDPQNRIYYLMIFLTIFSWSGTARLVRGQILFLREQEYMVAAEAMGFSTARKIFKHLIPNVFPQLIVSMTLSLGSMILYEASLSYLGLGTQAPYASWGTMVNSTNDLDILKNHFNVWGPSGICIVIAVLGFNFVGDGLRDALDPKMRR